MSLAISRCLRADTGIAALICVAAGCTSEPSGSINEMPVTESNVTQAMDDSEGPADSAYKFQPPALSDAEIRNGWISLFDGISLFGWNVPDNTNWRVENGSLVADGGNPGLLTTPFEFDDFELRCDFHLEAGGNSGVFLRTAANAASPVTDTYEVNICDSHETHPTGSLVGRHRASPVPPVEGEWHTFHVRCERNRIRVRLDGTGIVDFRDDTENTRESGFIGLQMNGGRIAFRNVCVRPVGTSDLFDGGSLSGWSVVDGSNSSFEVINGAIHVRDGPGFLQTDSTYGDFLLHVEARTNGDSLNSGVFFRAQSGTRDAPSHGYEMQIQNGFRNDDRTLPADSGTGAIFRRAPARYVVANDREWLTATLLAQGDRLATWVNGYQVVNWQDTRDPHENPRRGRRLDAGHISLQGHDPTTDLDFHVIRIHEFAENN